MSRFGVSFFNGFFICLILLFWRWAIRNRLLLKYFLSVYTLKGETFHKGVDEKTKRRDKRKPLRTKTYRQENNHNNLYFFSVCYIILLNIFQSCGTVDESMNVIYDVTITQLDLEQTVEIDFHVVLQKSDLIFDKVSRN